VAFSKSGRDTGKMYVILKVLNEHLVLLVDGESRKMDNPKTKNLKHLNVTNTIAQDIKTALLKGEIPNNQAFRNSLRVKESTRELRGKEV
jgi:large subunit ribosomal protein L14e